jgi:hypothetical protein
MLQRKKTLSMRQVSIYIELMREPVQGSHLGGSSGPQPPHWSAPEGTIDLTRPSRTPRARSPTRLQGCAGGRVVRSYAS